MPESNRKVLRQTGDFHPVWFDADITAAAGLFSGG